MVAYGYDHDVALPLTERTIDSAIRDGKAAELRRDGLTYREIATALGCSVAGAHDMVSGRCGRPYASPPRNCGR